MYKYIDSASFSLWSIIFKCMVMHLYGQYFVQDSGTEKEISNINLLWGTLENLIIRNVVIEYLVPSRSRVYVRIFWCCLFLVNNMILGIYIFDCLISSDLLLFNQYFIFNNVTLQVMVCF